MSEKHHQNASYDVTPKVSVVTITYNQEKYIRQALECFVNQNTKFGVEFIVADDCSTDDTPNIISEYAKTYPGMIKPILRKRNIGAQNNCIDALQTARGEYVALCEGDDYWTNTNKLQKQADFLDTHADYALCFHPVEIIFEDGAKKESTFPVFSGKPKLNVDELLKWNFIQTNSVMYRRQSYDSIPDYVLPLDWYLHLYHAQFGKIGYTDEVMSVYRRHDAGLWWEADGDRNILLKKQSIPLLGLYIELLALFAGNTSRTDTIYYRINDLLNKLHSIDGNLLHATLDAYPGMIDGLVSHQAAELIRREQYIQYQERELVSKNTRLQLQDKAITVHDERIRALEASLFELENSKLHKLRDTVHRQRLKLRLKPDKDKKSTP